MPSRIAAGITATAVRGVVIAFLSILIAGDAAVAQQPAKPKTPAANSAQPAKPAATDNGKCIGLVSAIGDTFSLQKIGITVFGNELNTVPIDSWQIDNLVISKISAFLSKTGRCDASTIRREPFPRSMNDNTRSSITTRKISKASYDESRRPRSAITMSWS
jgi:hypothetical protein